MPNRDAKMVFLSVSLALLLCLLALDRRSSSAVEAPAASEIALAVEGSTLVYVSDYLSFVGEDGGGHVAFALDNNRGRDGNAYQAEHLVVLHDERRGWIEVHGNGRYENAAQELATIPGSPFFTFQGSPTTGVTVASRPNQLVLTIEPIMPAISRRHEGARYWLGSAGAILEWDGRRLKGRVIYESLLLPDFNRLTRTYWDLWKEFQGLYLAIGGEGDLYVHSQQSDRLIPLVGRVAGFSVLDGTAQRLDNPALLPLAKALARGFYRWPVEWRLEWKGSNGAVETTLTLSDRKVFANWFIGGFAMGIVKGTITINGRTLPLYGLAELLI